MTSTLLSAIWNETDTDTDPNALAETVRARLSTGELVPAGNFRNVAPGYWASDSEA